MSASDWREQLPAKVRTLQIVVGTMFMGCLLFLFIGFLVGQKMNKAVEQPMLTYIGLAVAAMILPAWIILPGIIVSQGRKNINQKLLPASKQVNDMGRDAKKENENSLAQAIMQLLQTKTIIAGALLEGAIFFLLIVYIVEHSILSVLPAMGLLVLLIIQMPTTGRVTNWIEDQIRLVEEERQLG